MSAPPSAASASGSPELRAVLEALARIEQRLERLDAVTGKLADPRALAALERSLGALSELPALLAIAFDSTDHGVKRLQAGGMDVDRRLANLARAAERLSSDEALAMLDAAFCRIDRIQRLLESGILDASAVSIVAKAGRALADAAAETRQGVGPFGMLRALAEPEVRAALGLLVSFARRMGAALHAENRAPLLRSAEEESRAGVRWMSAGASIFGVKKYAAALTKIVERKQIQASYRQDLVAVRPSARQAVFRHLDDGSETVLRYEMLHAVPPQSAPDFVKKGPLADSAGWVDVHKHTLQHAKYPNVWSLGDASSLPTSRTGAAIRKQAPVLVANLLAARRGEPLSETYDGYASCPLVTGYGKLILAEFDYDGNPTETFPFDQSEERFSMWAMKVYALPELYWNGMLKGRA